MVDYKSKRFQKDIFNDTRRIEMSFNDWMRRLVIGKKRDRDFAMSDLPQNRKQVFKFIYKNRALELFNAGLLCVVFCLPLIVWQILSVYQNVTLQDSFMESYGVKDLLHIEYYNLNLEAITIKNIINVPCLMLASVGLAGASYVVRKLCWNETVSLFKDFGRGIKNSWLQYLIIAFIIALNFYVTDVIWNYFWHNPDRNLTLMLPILLLVLVVDLFVLITNCYAFGLASNYTMGIFQIYKASLMLAFKKLFTNILMVIAGILPVALSFIIANFSALFYFIGLCILIFGGIGYTTLVISLFLFRQFDEYINKFSYPEIVNKGIYADGVYIEEIDEVTELEIEKLAEQIASEYDEESQE